MSTIIWWNSVCGNSSEVDAFWKCELSSFEHRLYRFTDIERMASRGRTGTCDITRWSLCGFGFRRGPIHDRSRFIIYIKKSDSITVNTTNPDLTRCFQSTVLAWLPCAYLWLCSLFYVPALATRPTCSRWADTSLRNAIKLFLGVCICVVSLAGVVKTIWDGASGSELVLVQYVTPAVYFVSMMLATFLTHYEFRKGVISGGVLFFYWMLLSFLGIVPFRSNIMRIQNAEQAAEDMFHIVAFYVSYGLAFLQLVLSLFSDVAARPEFRHPDRKKEPLLLPLRDQHEFFDSSEIEKVCPDITAPFWLRMLFLWITNMLVRGYRRELTADDLLDLKPEDKCDEVVTRFELEWKKELKETKWKMVNKDTILNEVHLGNVDDEEGPEKYFHSLDSFPPMQPTSSFPANCKPPRPPSIWKAIVRAFGGYFALGGVFKLCFDLITLITPLILNLLITFIGSRDPLAWRGYAYVAALFIIACTRTILDQNHWHVGFVTGMRLRTAIVGVIYRKALRLSTSARRETTGGEIVNLMSVDAQKLQDAPVFLHLLWSTPLTIGLCMYFLWQQLGPSVLAGLLLILLMIPVNGVIAQKSRKLQVKQMKCKDGRINLMNELLNGIKVLKLYAWEVPFRERILEKRKNELEVLQTAAFMEAGSAISWFMAPYLVALGTFSVYVLSSPENVLDANKAFVSLALFNIMKFPMSKLPATITSSVE
ncbi:Multidrug resistance-associated protein 1, partial [Lamellibrachia satsuma]